MCGIAGITYRNQPVNSQLLQKSADLMRHRGPDDEGVYISPDQKTGWIHRRLSFIDLSPSGRQPLVNTETQQVVTFNGEIYNYIELKKELEQLGYRFHTQTDTEVLLHGYHAWGEALPERLEGMFAFAIYDPIHQKIFLCRDRFGIKPLYYYLDEEKFIFASEIKSILVFDDNLKKIRPESVSLFLANRYIPTPYTIWEGIKKIQPAHSITFHLNRFELSQHGYWKLNLGKQALSREETYATFYDLLIKSLQEHLRSDVPIGSFLSGGYDSSALVYLMQRELKYPAAAFSIGFENWEQSEDVYAQMVADTVGATLYTAKPEKINLSAVKKLMWHYDDPIADISIIPTYEVSRLAAQHVKAVVSGEGADEEMGGYWWHKPEKFMYKNKWRSWVAGQKSASFADIKYHYIQAMSMGLYNRDELKKAFKGVYLQSVPDDPFAHFDQFNLPGSNTLQQLQYLDLHTFMPELILAKVDRASMAHSLEVRVPFLHHHLVEFLFGLSPSSYFTRGEQKPLLKKLLTGKVPEVILNRSKQGFVGPDAYYMNMEVYQQALVNGRLVSDGVVEPLYIRGLLNNKDHWRLWKLFVLENWWQNWV
jgi:asparagine synthase (glutamine-hydrolysing)